MGGRIAVVDAKNQFVRWEARRRIHENGFVHRSIHILLFDGQGRLVIQQRHSEKQTFPLFWDGSCAGHVEESDYTKGFDEDLDEVYASTAFRELEEELGVQAELTLLAKFSPTAGLHYEQIHFYRAVHDGPFTLQESEVAAIQRVTPEAFDRLAQDPNTSMTPLLIFLVAWVREQGLW